jgi:subtilase family serine protease
VCSSGADRWLATDEALYDSVFTSPGVTFVASTGDYGAANPEYPAFSLNVVSIGGTSLTLMRTTPPTSETGRGYYSNSVGGQIDELKSSLKNLTAAPRPSGA